MANNRMYVVCLTCNPSGIPGLIDDEGAQMIAKYYPSSGWYSSDVWNNKEGETKTSEKLCQFFERHRHEDFSSDGKKSLFALGYEI